MSIEATLINSNDNNFNDILDIGINENQNNRITDINKEILERNPITIIINNNIYSRDNNNVSSAQYIFYRNWDQYYTNNLDDSIDTIRINYEYIILGYYRDIFSQKRYLNQLYAIDAESIEGGLILINETVQDIEYLKNKIIAVGNVYLGILNR
jgi:hypothetical protein